MVGKNLVVQFNGHPKDDMEEDEDETLFHALDSVMEEPMPISDISDKDESSSFVSS